MKIRILHVITTIDVGGAENHLLSLVRGLDRERYQITIAYLKGRGELRDTLQGLGATVIPMKMRFDTDVRVLGRLLRLIRTHRYHIVHTHLPRADLYGILAARLTGVPAILSSKHNVYWALRRNPYRSIHRWISSFCDRIIVISGYVGAFMAEIGLDPERITTVRYGLDPSPYARLNDRAPIRKEFGIEPETSLVGTIARLTEQKGLLHLIRAFANVLKQAPASWLLIVGRGELETEMKRLTRELEIEEHVIFAGFRTDIPAILAEFDLFVLPSLWEGFGLVLLEAMAANLPIVATAVTAIPEVVTDGETGILVPPGDVPALSDAMLKLIQDRDLARAMGRAGRRRLEDRFSVTTMVDRIERIYQRSLKSS
ncbi:MAG: glycosyltransferase [Candidatus Bipolaricaulia bacterium]